MKKIHIKGWQSWTPCKIRRFSIKRQCDYSPHHIDDWYLEPVKNLKDPIVGWSSWCAFGKNISEEKILDNAKEFSSYPIKNKDAYILIDDGWTRWGDWHRCSRQFPKGLKYVAKKIKTMKLKPGLWIAPFLVDRNSQYASLHPDHLIRDRFGLVDGFRMLPFNIPCIAMKGILDMEHAKGAKYVRDCISNCIENWGFELLKLDFLYSIYFNPAYKTPEIPDQILKNLLTFIKKTYPHVYTIGCGCPLGPAVGLVDAMRISADTIHPYLDTLWPLNMLVNSNRLRALEENIAIRKNFDLLWNIDPDVLTTRKSTGLTDKELGTLKKIILSLKRGILFLGDDLRNIQVKTGYLHNAFI